MRYSVLLTIIVAAGLVLLFANPVWAGPRAGRARALASVVQVNVTTEFGSTRRCSGYLFSPNGQVLTSYHAISDAVAISVFHADYGVFEVSRIRRIDPRADVAVLVLEGVAGAELVSAHLADSRALAAGDNVYVLHHSIYNENVIYPTKVVNVGYPRQFQSCFLLEDFASELMMIELAGPFDGGSAGGLVCDENFDVVGILLGGGPETDQGRTGYALMSGYFKPLLISTYDVAWSNLRTDSTCDAEYFDKFFGPEPQRVDYQAPMPECYLAWFGPMYHTELPDFQFTTEINDNIDQNWFATKNLVIDGLSINEISAARIVFWPAYLNSWDIVDEVDRYVFFDADSLFTKKIYRNRDTEERIITRYILAMALTPGQHSIRYENRGANYKSTGMRAARLDLRAAEVTLIDIEGLNLVSWLLLPNGELRIGEGEPVHYEVDKRPLNTNEVTAGIRRVRYPVIFH
ncbi:trypsin-like peptidase domain-containing protein [bacterium]|nr:trypsin-like peptidase domain-containing protein [bacterium]